MKSKAFGRKSTYLAALAALLVVSFVAGTLATSNQPVDAQGVNPLAAAAPSGNVVCTIGNIATTDTLLVFSCPAAPPPIVLFGYPTTTPAEARIANRYLATLFTAYALSKPVGVVYSDNPALNPPPAVLCPVATCRLIVGLGF